MYVKIHSNISIVALLKNICFKFVLNDNKDIKIETYDTAQSNQSFCNTSFSHIQLIIECQSVNGPICTERIKTLTNAFYLNKIKLHIDF